MPSEADLKLFYRDEYRLSYKGVLEPKLKHVARGGYLAASRLRALSEHIHAGDRLLDVGSGGGEWLYALQRSGVVATGLEPNRGYAEFARREYDVDVRDGGLEENPLAPGSFEAVTLFHVLEHLRDPVSTLRVCLDLLKPGGRLIVEVPNMASQHQHPHKRFHPAHVVGFTPHSLALAAVYSGGRTLEQRTDAFGRNLVSVIEEDPDPHLGAPARVSNGDLAALRPRGGVRYFVSPTTFYRFGLRMKQFARERAAIWGAPPARHILDSILRS